MSPVEAIFTPSGVSLHFSEPRPFCITKPNNDFFYVGQTSLMRSRLVSGPAIHIAALSRRAYCVKDFLCTCVFMSCYWSKPHVDNWSFSYVHSIHVWLKENTFYQCIFTRMTEQIQNTSSNNNSNCPYLSIFWSVYSPCNHEARWYLYNFSIC